ncbi:ATP synthase F1 subunit delta [Flavobacterium sp. AG291]|uniref:ATP synthase F1 subunit delta n=1 Tax=Flavobacterium sp. AG291 TaxID=2184000 RepID=UPI000E0CB8AC|nr:ATP synthase F1 subunit delta [Flavobacterium sp. AG291]RDI07939.1 ATP synthase F1 subcomplex delta subunit [Flavobacterium sp. AG291]
MTGSRAAIRYAKAILDMAQVSGAAGNVNEDMALIASTIKDNAELSTFVNSPVVKAEVKEAALKEIFAGTQTITQGLFHLLHENKRFEILPLIAEEYKNQFDILNGIEVATVTTAIPLTEELEAKVMAKIKEFSSKKVSIKNVVDPAIIGGFIIRIGDRQFNASVANRLTTLRRELSN